MTLLFVSWKISAKAWCITALACTHSTQFHGNGVQKAPLFSIHLFFLGILRGFCAAETPIELLREGKILRLCLKSVREIEKSVRNSVRLQRAVKD